MSALPIEPMDGYEMEPDPEPDVEPMDGLDRQLVVLMRKARRRPLTIADLMHLDPRVGRTELIDGTLILTPSPDFEHQDLCHELVSEFKALLRNRGIEGHAYSAVNVFEPGSDRSLYIPDVAVVDKSKIVRIHGQGEGVFPDGVLCIVEVTSSNAATDLRVKRDRFRELKIPYLVVNRDNDPATYEVFGEWPEWAEPIRHRP